MKNPKKVRVLVDTFHLYQALTGIKTYTVGLCQGLELVEKDQVSYFTFPHWKSAVTSTFLRGKTTPAIKILNHILFFIWKLIVLPGYIYWNRIDVIISPDFVAPKIRWRKVVTLPVIHDLFFWEMPQNYNPIWRPYFLWMIRRGINHQSVVLTTSNYIQEKIKARLDFQVPIEVAYQSFRPRVQKSQSGGNSPLFEKLSAGNYFLHVGVFDRRKNLPFLIRSFHEFAQSNTKPFYLVLAGSEGLSIRHDDWHTCKQLIRDLSMEDRIYMPGFVPDEDLALLYAQAQAYVFPSLEEGFGIPVLEALSYGIPVLVSARDPLTEIGGEAVLSFDPYQHSDLVRCMELVQKPEVRTELIASGHQRVQQFSSQQFAARVHEIIKKYACS